MKIFDLYETNTGITWRDRLRFNLNDRIEQFNKLQVHSAYLLEIVEILIKECDGKADYPELAEMHDRLTKFLEK